MIKFGTKIVCEGNVGVVVRAVELWSATYYICLFDGVEVLLTAADFGVLE